jgi:hypothetical protein
MDVKEALTSEMGDYQDHKIQTTLQKKICMTGETDL